MSSLFLVRTLPHLGIFSTGTLTVQQQSSQQPHSPGSQQQPQATFLPQQPQPSRQHRGMGKQNGSHSTLKQGRVTVSVPHSTTQYALHGALQPHRPQQSDLPQQSLQQSSQQSLQQAWSPQHAWSQQPGSPQPQQSPAAAGKAKTRQAATANNTGINLIAQVSLVYASNLTLPSLGSIRFMDLR
jgi:hypothetical protein